MTAIQMIWLSLLLLIAAFLVTLIVMIRRSNKRQSTKTHGPHTPNAGNDPVASARSMMEGNGAGAP